MGGAAAAAAAGREGAGDDGEEYEDRPISNAAAITVDAPARAGGADEGVVERPAAEATVAATFQVEVVPAEADAGAAAADEGPPAAAAERAPPTDEAWEANMRCAKNTEVAEVSAASGEEGAQRPGRVVGSGDDAKPVPRNWKGDELDRDLKLVYESGASKFRSELRVGTSFGKWKMAGGDTVTDGQRVGSTATVFGVGEDGMTVGSMFDNDGLQPPHMQALVQGQVTNAVEDQSARCSEDVEVFKATPDPVPDFHKPVDVAGQTEEKGGVLKELELPLRKTKGKCDKHREQRVEVICTPIVSQDAMDGEEGENRELLKAEMGLPDVLWEEYHYRGSKQEVTSELEMARIESDSRFITLSERRKGDFASQINSASAEQAVEGSAMGYARDVAKTAGHNAEELEGTKRELATENIVKNAEWAFDEYLRPESMDVAGETQAAVADTLEQSEVLEMKFDVAFANDEERHVFAEAQRAMLAKALGIPVDSIEIGGVKPGSPITMIRFSIKSTDAAMIPEPRASRPGTGTSGGSGGAAAADDGAGAAAERPASAADGDLSIDAGADDFVGIDAMEVTVLRAGAENGHRQLTQRLQATFGSRVPPPPPPPPSLPPVQSGHVSSLPPY